MLADFRHFQAGPDPAGRVWQVEFLFQQNAISIRHSDTVDVKFALSCGGERDEKVIALPHAGLLSLSAKLGRPVTDPWVSRLAALHLRHVMESGEDSEKALITASLEDLERHATAA